MLTDAMRAHLDGLVTAQRVVLFMKGTRDQPRCGFSARVVEMIDAYVDTYATIDVLADMNLREAVKEYAQWPTFPQLFVDGELVGGADVITQLHERGELAAVLGESGPVAAPAVTLTPSAAARIREVVGDAEGALRLQIDASFRYEFALVDAPGPRDVIVHAGGIQLVFDPASARRADGMTMDFVSGPRGSGLVVDNPNEPPRVTPLSVEELHRWRAEGRPHHLFDVRTDEEWRIAHVEGSTLLDAAGEAKLHALPPDAILVMLCHHGVRSQHAAEHLLAQGWRHVYNVVGGIDAWSRRVDPKVPTY
jgi:monothiol glutaredoxin